jgi:poly(glycerol-phosphate) alpha-glucosyltransferase
VISSLRLSSGGPTHSVTRLCEALNELGAPTEIATVAGAGEQAPPPGITPVHAFPLAWPPRLRRSPELEAFLDHEAPRFDLIHVHGLWQWPGTAARRVAIKHGLPLVISPRGMLEPWALGQRAWLKGPGSCATSSRNLRR